MATMDLPASASARGGSPGTASGSSAANLADRPEITISGLRSTHVRDDSGDVIGHAMNATAEHDGSIGRFFGTQLNGSSLVIQETIVGDSTLLGMGSTERITVIGGTGLFARCTGWYMIELDAFESAGIRSGLLRFGGFDTE